MNVPAGSAETSHYALTFDLLSDVYCCLLQGSDVPEEAVAVSVTGDGLRLAHGAHPAGGAAANVSHPSLSAFS